MTFEQLATVLSPFIAVLIASSWLHGQLSALREKISGMTAQIHALEREVDRLRSQQETRTWQKDHGRPQRLESEQS